MLSFRTLGIHEDAGIERAKADAAAVEADVAAVSVDLTHRDFAEG